MKDLFKEKKPQWECCLQEDLISINLDLTSVRYYEYLNFDIAETSFTDIPKNGSFRIQRKMFKDVIKMFKEFWNISPYNDELIAAPGDTIYNIITDEDWSISKIQKIKVTLKEEKGA